MPLSPSQLNAFLGCEYRTWLDIQVGRGLEVQKVHSADAEMLAEQGVRHEQQFLQSLKDSGLDVVELHAETSEEQAHQTEEAMAAGREVIHQACFRHGDWTGYADFLIRIEEPCATWEWSYEVHDAKLARSPKPDYIFQLLYYTREVERLQGGTRPLRMHLILGDGERPPFEPAEFDAYAAQVVTHFLDRRQELEDGSSPSYPYPVEDCDFCPYAMHCDGKRRADDHLSLVALLQQGQGRKLEDAGIATMTALAETAPAMVIPRLSSQTFENLRAQASLQHRSRDLPVPLTEFREFARDCGFARLPEASPGDVFFDFEGDRFWGDQGLEYLFGTGYLDEAGDWTYWPLWAHNEAEERIAFETWVDWITARLADDPGLHVYHYNAYEPTALKRLMSRYGTRERELDELLRRLVFVDLYGIVRQAIRAGVESYSLKAIERLYEFARSPLLKSGTGATRSYETWRETHDDAVLEQIAVYNEDDCRSTRVLRDWLLEQRAASGFDFGSLPPIEESEPTAKRLAWLARVEPLRTSLEAGLPDDDTTHDEEQAGKQRAADLLTYHDRERKPVWWQFFARLAMSSEQLRDEDSEAIGDLSLESDLPTRDNGKSIDFPLRFPPQTWKLAVGDPVAEAPSGAFANVVEIDEAQRVVWLRRQLDRASEPLPTSIIPGGPIATEAQEDALIITGQRVAAKGLGPTGELDASVDLLMSRNPRFAGAADSLDGLGSDLDRLAARVQALDESVLWLQGPPGSGKTYTGARVAVRLIEAGLSVGVVATSHKAICKFLEEVDLAADERNTSFKGRKKKGAGSDTIYESDRIVTRASVGPPDDEVRLVAGTAWLWAHRDMERSVDVLFIDEAGQVSLADAVAVARGARNVVLLGDPQQLAHVSQGSHPRGSGVSVLRHLLGDASTVPPERGVLLETTWRMHPDVCSFVSTAMYDSKLAPVGGLELQTVESGGLSGSGLRWMGIGHEDCRQSSEEEAAYVAAQIETLLDGGRFRDRHGAWHELTLEHILVVAPYNAQVRCLKARLPDGAKVGTVDKFQGQEAPVVFFSMASSSGDDVPRGKEFLFSRNRLNVAVSRAQALAVVVCSPKLLRSRCSSVDDMRLVNMLCRFSAEATSG